MKIEETKQLLIGSKVSRRFQEETEIITLTEIDTKLGLLTGEDEHGVKHLWDCIHCERVNSL